MIRRFLSSCLVAVCVTGSSLAQDLAITNVTVFDGTGAEPYRATVMFDDGLISAIDKAAGPAPAGVPAIDGSDLSLLPGFFDLHVHYTPIGQPATTPQISQEYAKAGVTSVYDFAQAPEAFAPRREWLQSLPGPRVNFAARMSTTNGHGADWSDTSTTKWVNTPYAATEAVKELLPYQPDVIKVFTDGWRYGSGVDNTSMNEPTLTALVEEAHANGLKVLTHTVTKDRAEIAGRSGVDVIAHSVLDKHVDQVTIDALKNGSTAYAGTLAVYNPDKLETTPFEREHPSFKSRQARFQVGLDNMKALYEGGVLIALGTDAGMPRTPHGYSTLSEMELMVRAGLPQTAALMAGTSNSARAVGVYDQRGSIEVGKDADVVLIAGKPWENISDLHKTKYTFVGGEKVYGEGAPAPIEATVMASSDITDTLIADFDREDGRSSRDTLVVGDPDGGMERSWQVFEVIDDGDRGGVLHLSADLALREDARAGIVVPMNVGSVQPADGSAYKGVTFDARGDDKPYTLVVATTEGRWSCEFEVGEDWETVSVPFKDLIAPADGAEWTGDNIVDVRLLVKRPGGDTVWFELDNVKFF
ncbi:MULTISPECIES: CIA30 family protein [Hyphomonas]|uniref:Amidohydrolase n=1 Tax=Hyphomonas adhaerens TaxID=81029 RepID=A0A3B9GSU1_9PROT|nr:MULTISPECIES: CIA30 family protein [Hyphomonas]MBB41969.1 amidohydrolase [Hyphomonas sp.]HAE25519.1 amidohydrolase [Hyphomonas adhaerens]|tara:strand:- start:11837 stop:13594 length:1758 start_codon:yes stop_codon:yes gene_type:complete